MKKTRKFNFKTSIVLLLSLLLCFTMTMSIACSDKANSSSSSSVAEEKETYPTDYQVITNGDFEFSTFTKKADQFPVSSSIGWTLSRDSITTSAPSSSKTSGIIDTEAEAYKAIADKVGFNPGTPASNGLVAEGAEFTGDGIEVENEDKLPTNGTKVLMINNKTSVDGEGTAQKFTSSSSLSLAKHEYARVSVWVLTHDLKSNVEGVDFGAYIAIQNTLSSATTPLIVKNINTNDSWAQYTFYLEASDFSTSSFKIVLGLGFGSSKLRAEFVEGLAFFDNVHYEIIDKAEYDEGIATVNADDVYTLFDGDKVRDELIANEAGVEFVANENKAFTNRALALSHARKTATLVSVTGASSKNELSEGQADGTATVDTLANAITAIGEEIKAPYDALNDSSAVYFNFTAPTSYSFETDAFTVGSNEFKKLSFWVKSSVEYNNQKALTVTLNDYGTGVETPVETVLADSVITKKDVNKNFNDWVEYTVYVSNVIDSESNASDRTFTLSFDFGITERSELTDGDWSLTKGYAIIAGFAIDALSEDDFAIANVAANSNAKKVALSADLPNGVDKDESKDSYNFSYGATDKIVIENNVATNVSSYNGVVGNTKAVGGKNDNSYRDDKVVAGVINTEYLNNYRANGILTDEESTTIDSLEKLNDNKYLQPLMIKGLEGATASYGYLGANAVLSANSTTYITVDVKVIGDAKAYIYIAKADALESFNVWTLTDDNKAEVEIKTAITASECGDGWFTVRFMITTGNESLAYRPEFWNGTRDGATAATGIVLFDNYTATTSSKSVETLKEELRIEFGDTDETATKYEYTRVPTKYLSTDENGEDVEQIKEYAPATVCAIFANSKAFFADYSIVYTVDEVDNRTPADTETETPDSSTATSDVATPSSFNWALQLTSIILVVVLLALLVIVLVRAILKKRGSRKQATKAYYSKDSREALIEKAEARKARKARLADQASDAEEVEEEVKPYDYDNPENNIEPEEEVVEEAEAPAEEVVEAPAEETEAPAAEAVEAPVEEAEAPAEEAAEAPVEEVEAPSEEKKED